MLIYFHVRLIATTRKQQSYWCTVLSHIDKVSTIMTACVFLVWVQTVRTPVLSTIVGMQFVSFLTTTVYVWKQTVVYTCIALILACLYFYHVIPSPLACQPASSPFCVYPLALWLIHIADFCLCLTLLPNSKVLILRISLNLLVLGSVYAASTMLGVLECGQNAQWTSSQTSVVFAIQALLSLYAYTACLLVLAP